MVTISPKSKATHDNRERDALMNYVRNSVTTFICRQMEYCRRRQIGAGYV